MINSKRGNPERFVPFTIPIFIAEKHDKPNTLRL